MNLRITTKESRGLIDLTDDISQHLPESGAGVASIFVLHTTAALTTIDSDPGIDGDFFDFLSGITPNVKWRHPHNPPHVPAHILASIIGSSVAIPYVDAQLQLGTWQRIVLVELDGPRERKLIINFTPIIQ